MTPAGKAIGKAIAALQQLQTATGKGAASLCEDADSALIVRDIMRDYATIGDALAVELAFHAGLDGAQFNPSLIDALADFEAECNLAAGRRHNTRRRFDKQREWGTLNRVQQGC